MDISATPFSRLLIEAFHEPFPFPMRELITAAIELMPEPEWGLSGIGLPVPHHINVLSTVKDVIAEMQGVDHSAYTLDSVVEKALAEIDLESWRQTIVRLPDFDRLRLFARFADLVDPDGMRAATLMECVRRANPDAFPPSPLDRH